VLDVFARALRDLGRPRVLAVMLLPMLGAIVLWALLGWLFWDAWTSALSSLMAGSGAARWLSSHGAAWVLDSLSVVLAIALLLPAMLVTMIIVTELVAMPVIVSVVGSQYPTLVKAGHGSVLGSIANAFVAIAVFGVLWITTLPLWLTGIGAIVLPALISAYLNQRLFRYDALADHASAQEYAAIVKGARGRLYTLGLLLALLYYIPFVNLIAPVLAGLAFTHLCLTELARLRGKA
jgi:uncharacterized protein involved in cysteine biosynthesis